MSDADDGAIAMLVRDAKLEQRDPVAELLRAGVRQRLLGIATTSPKIGRFVVLEVAGRGATGTVFAAYDPRLDRKVALKLLHGKGDGVHERVLHEARALAKLSHPHVVAIHEADRAEAGTFIVMQFVAGGDLRAWLAERPRDPATIVAAFTPLADALAAAHAAGVVHGDLKPQNIVVAEHGLCIADFGVAHVLEGPAGPQGGTAGYLAPEREAGGPASAAADQFAFAVTMGEALLGRRAEPDALDRAPGLPRRVPAILARARASVPAERWPSMGALASALRVATRPRRWPTIVVASGALGVAIAIAYRGGATDRCAADAELATEWGESRAAELRAAFEAVAPARGAALAQPVIVALDGAAQRFATTHRDVCEATWVRGEQSDSLHDARMRCLARRRGELAATITTLLAVADAGEAAGALDAVDALPDVERCSTARLATAGHDEPEAAQRGRIDELRADIDRSWAEFRLARYRPARDRALAIVEAATATGYAPLQLEAEILLGATQARIDTPVVADATLHRAYLSAMRLHDDAAAADVALRILRSAMFAGRLDRVEALADFARGAALRAELDDAEVDGVLGEARLDAGDAVRATASLEHALAHEQRGERRAILHALLGSAALERGAPAQALASYREALAAAERHWGALHPALGFYLQRLGRGQHAVGEHVAALATLQRSLDLREQALGTDDRAVAGTLADLADVELALGRHADARIHLERALAIRSAAYGPGHARVAELHGRLAALARAEGDPATALAESLHAARLRRAATPDHPELAALELDVAELLIDGGRTEEARGALARAGETLARVPADAPARAGLAARIDTVARRLP